MSYAIFKDHKSAPKKYKICPKNYKVSLQKNKFEFFVNTGIPRFHYSPIAIKNRRF